MTGEWQREFDQLRSRVDDHEKRLSQVDVLLVKVELMTDTFKQLKVIGSGVIVAILATAIGIVFFGSPGA